MKKLNVLLIVSMLAAALLAANPPGKLVRLEIINNTDFPVYLKLEGQNTGAFYYLTVLDGDTTTFTVLTDSYKRTTWACDGIKSSGKLVMTGNVRLNFTPCGHIPTRTVEKYDFLTGTWFLARFPNFGEPTQEKVIYFKQYSDVFWRKTWDPFLWPHWNLWLMYKVGVKNRTYKSPLGMFFRYRY